MISGDLTLHCDRLLRRTLARLRRPVDPQVSRHTGLAGSDREFPALTGRSGTQRARPLHPELAAPLGVWPLSQLAECAAGRSCWRLCADVAVLPCCTVHRISSSGTVVLIGSSWNNIVGGSVMNDAASQ
jgi:hypothetical protein